MRRVVCLLVPVLAGCPAWDQPAKVAPVTAPAPVAGQVFTARGTVTGAAPYADEPTDVFREKPLAPQQWVVTLKDAHQVEYVCRLAAGEPHPFDVAPSGRLAEVTGTVGIVGPGTVTMTGCRLRAVR